MTPFPEPKDEAQMPKVLMVIAPKRSRTAIIHVEFVGGVMTEKTVAEKARVKPGTTIAVLNRVPGIVESLGLPPDATFVSPGKAQIVFLFVKKRAELDARMPKAVAALAPGAALWVFYPKGSKAAGLDVNRDSIWALAEKLGLGPLGINRVDDTWTAFRLRPVRRVAARTALR